MRVLVWGLGYVGTVSATCLAKMGHEVVGIEPNAMKVQALNAGRSAVKEPGLDELVGEAVASGRLRATDEGRSKVCWADLSLICVSTPVAADGSPVLDYVRNATIDIARGLSESSNYHTVVLRSTVFPGTVRNVLKPLLEEFSNRRAGYDFGLASNPEFLRETSAIHDFHAPPYTVIGELDKRSGDVVEALYEGVRAPISRVALEEAEVLKLVSNAFHALKIGFANEIGRVCDAINIDSHAIMKLVCADTKLNISPAYLRPGFAFGGSCLPKDLRSLTYSAHRLGVRVPILEAILPSNYLQIEAARFKIHSLGVRRVAVLGLSFKPGSDDLRESPIVALILGLWQDGVDVLVYDPDVNAEKMLGSNRECLEGQFRQIRRILRCCFEDVLHECEAVVVCQNRPEFREALESVDGSVTVLDLVRITEDSCPPGIANYQGISW